MNLSEPDTLGSESQADQERQTRLRTEEANAARKRQEETHRGTPDRPNPDGSPGGMPTGSNLEYAIDSAARGDFQGALRYIGRWLEAETNKYRERLEQANPQAAAAAQVLGRVSSDALSKRGGQTQNPAAQHSNRQSLNQGLKQGQGRESEQRVQRHEAPQLKGPGHEFGPTKPLIIRR
jgi:hypothetical protein